MMKPIRAAAVLIKDNKILLMYRKKDEREYYTFPGGSVERNETVEEAVLRELMEETSITAKVDRLLYVHDYSTSEQYYYLCEYTSGEPRLGESIEKERMKKGKDNIYKPLWMGVDKLNELLLYPLEIRDWLIEDLKSGFQNEPRKATLRTDELRRSLVDR